MLPSSRLCWPSAPLLLLLGLLAGHFCASAQAPTIQWDRTVGGSSPDFLRVLQPTPDGGYLLAGTSRSGISGDKTQANKGNSDFWVVKLDATGTQRWDRTIGGSGYNELAALQLTPDGGYLLAGWSSSGIQGDKTQPTQGFYDYWLVKLSARGEKQWDRCFGGSEGDYLFGLLATPDGGYLLGGTSTSPLSGDKTQPSQGSSDYWLVKLDANGEKQWDRTLGGRGVDQLDALQLPPDGGYLLAGSSDSPRSGDKTQPSQGKIDYWVVKLDATGTKLWDRTFGGSEEDNLRALLLTADGGCLLGGFSTSPRSGDKTQASQKADYWVVKLDATGTQQWDRTLGRTEGDEVLSALQPTLDGGYLLGGKSTSGSSGDKTQPSQGSSDYWVVKLDTQGTTQWDLTLGGNGEEVLNALQLTADGGYLLGGTSTSGISGEKTQRSQGTSDYWVVKLHADVITTTTSAAVPATLEVYPNPAHTHLTLRLPNHALPSGLRLCLLDARGQRVLSQPLVAPPGAKVSVEVGSHPAGMYLLRLEGPQGVVATQRLVLH